MFIYICAMNIQQAYNHWAAIYDTNANKTRDLEALALQKTLGSISFESCLEIGCGTGKNTKWLVQQAKQVVAVDFSEEMMNKAKEKITTNNVSFVQADITQLWNFSSTKFDLISCSLVLEDIENLQHIFKQASQLLNPNGYFYIGELHPFKQYAGSKARFENNSGGTTVLTCYTHHISQFIKAAMVYGYSLKMLEEFFDEDDISQIPRLLVLLFKYK